MRHPRFSILIVGVCACSCGSPTAQLAKEKTSQEKLSAVSGNTYFLTAKNSGLVLDVSGASKDDNAGLVQSTLDQQASQQWTLQQDSSGAFQVVNVNSGKCLDDWQFDSQNAAPVIQWTCKSSDQRNQLWNFVPQTDGTYQLVNVASGLCLDVSAASLQPGAPLQQWACWSGLNQRWSLSQTSGATSIVQPPTAGVGVISDGTGGGEAGWVWGANGLPVYAAGSLDISVPMAARSHVAETKQEIWAAIDFVWTVHVGLMQSNGQPDSIDSHLNANQVHQLQVAQMRVHHSFASEMAFYQFYLGNAKNETNFGTTLNPHMPDGTGDGGGLYNTYVYPGAWQPNIGLTGADIAGSAFLTTIGDNIFMNFFDQNRDITDVTQMNPAGTENTWSPHPDGTFYDSHRLDLCKAIGSTYAVGAGHLSDDVVVNSYTDGGSGVIVHLQGGPAGPDMQVDFPAIGGDAATAIGPLAPGEDVQPMM